MKEVLCYPCALRMSILHHLPSPPTDQNCVRTRLGSSERHQPILDEVTHPDFYIAHETEDSVGRCFMKGSFLSSLVQCNVFGTKVYPAEENKISWLCVACLGLYQFMDLLYAPLFAASVRQSPFIDSKAISINISVHRSFTFTWLVASTRYFNRNGMAETEKCRPPPDETVREELSNFKEFYVSDLRARIMVYLRHAHSYIISDSFRIIEAPGLNIYRQALSQESIETLAEVTEPPLKAFRAEGSLISGSCLTTQAFVYSGENDSVVLDVSCSHSPTEVVVTESGLPSEYGNNRVDCILQYGVLYEYVSPFLQKIGWGPPYNVYGAETRRIAASMAGTISHANIFLLGNYRKMTRNLSQSPWFSGGERVGTFSLQEVIAAPILPFFFPEGVHNILPDEKVLAATSEIAAQYPLMGVNAQRSGAGLKSQSAPKVDISTHPSMIASQRVFGFGRYKFHSAGREDVDVRMLGAGRPFVLEVVSPSKEHFSEIDLKLLTKRINASEMECVEVSDLRLTDTNVTVRLARHSESKVKQYRCVVWTSRGFDCPLEDPLIQHINSVRDIFIRQKTPLRVLHRRSLHTRERMVHSMHLRPINAHWFILDIETQAGTYIKEFVHGDMGRTIPNLGTLLKCRADIIQLDVVDMKISDVGA